MLSIAAFVGMFFLSILVALPMMGAAFLQPLPTKTSSNRLLSFVPMQQLAAISSPKVFVLMAQLDDDKESEGSSPSSTTGSGVIELGDEDEEDRATPPAPRKTEPTRQTAVAPFLSQGDIDPATANELRYSLYVNLGQDKRKIVSF